MIHLSRHFLHRRRAARAGGLAICLILALGACGTKEGPVDAGRRLCGGAADVALQIAGPGDPVDLCAGSDSVSAVLTGGGRYQVRVRFASEGTRFELQLVMRQRDDWPASLTVTDSLDEVSSNPDAVWVYYREAPGSGPALESYAASGGKFTLSFSDTTVAAGAMSGVSLHLRETGTTTDAGARLITEGFFTFAVEENPAGPIGPGPPAASIGVERPGGGCYTPINRSVQ
jgi:hypothetical protein